MKNKFEKKVENLREAIRSGKRVSNIALEKIKCGSKTRRMRE
jgi:hypothetical protein